jgi:hypothetical protein
MFPRFNTRAKELSQQHRLLGTVGSDSHQGSEIGTATLTLPDFINAASLKISLALAQPHLKLSSP